MSDTDEPMRRFEVPEVETLPEDLRERIDEETERAGFTESQGESPVLYSSCRSA